MKVNTVIIAFILVALGAAVVYLFRKLFKAAENEQDSSEAEIEGTPLFI